MNRLFQLLCLTLAIGWLPMTQHCRLESMGFPVLQCAQGENSGGEGCKGDGCQTLEGGAYKLAASNLSVTAPTLLAPLFLIEPPSLLSLDSLHIAPAPEEHGRPVSWVPNWQFVRRAAPPSRAPSVSLA